MPKLPTEPEEILDQFIQLSLLDVNDDKAAISIKQRLEQLSAGYQLKVSENEGNGLKESIIVGGIDKSKERHEDNNNIVIPIRYSGPSGKISIEFYLTLKNGHWLIKSVQRLN